MASLKFSKHSGANLFLNLNCISRTDLEPWFLNLVNQDDLIDTICISFAVSKQILETGFMHLETWFVWVSRGMNQPSTPINNDYMYNLSEVKLKFLSNKKGPTEGFFCITKVFLRPQNSFEIFLRQETSTVLQQKPWEWRSLVQISRQVLVCLILLAEFLLPTVDHHTL